MKLALIGPGLLSIPPQGWGAVETVIANLEHNCRAIGCETLIINTRSKDEAFSQIEEFSPDVVWIHYDVYISWFTGNSLNLKFKIWTTAHFAYLSLYPKRTKIILQLIQPIRYLHPSLWRIFSLPFKLAGHKQYSMVNYLKLLVDARDIVRLRSSLSIHLSHEIDSVMKKIVAGESTVLPNCAREDQIIYSRNAGNGRALCLGKIEPRKRQKDLASIDCIDFVGPIVDPCFSKLHPNYLGVWSRRDVEEKLTQYSALVLLSDAEAHALVVIEALLSGLSVLLSVEAASHLNSNLPFVAILDHEEINDIPSVKSALISLLANSQKNRPLARAYALKHFSCSSQQENLKQIINRD